MAQKKSNRWLWILGILTLVAIAVAFIGKQKGWIGKEKLTRIATEKAERRTILETVSGNGKIYPEIEVKLTPDVSGEVVELLIEEGDSVKVGQLLARINPDIYNSMTDRAEAAVNAAKSGEANASAGISQAQAQIAQIQAQIDNARKTLQRNKQLLSDGVIAQADYDNAETALRSLEAQLRSAQAAVQAGQKSTEGAGYNVKSAKASLKEARDNLNKTNIYAPMTGVVSKLNIEKGERVVGTSQFAGTEIMRIANMQTMEVQADISENEIVKVSLGDTALIEVDAYIDRKFKGIVTQIASSAKTGTQLTGDQITNFTVNVRILQESYSDITKNKQQAFRPGMSASVDIQTQRIDQALAVPIQAVTTREDTLANADKKVTAKDQTNHNEEIEELVFVYENGKVYGKNVTIGIQDETYIQILSGLNGGEEIVSAPYRTISKVLEDSLAVEKVTKEELYKKE